LEESAIFIYLPNLGIHLFHGGRTGGMGKERLPSWFFNKGDSFQFSLKISPGMI